MINSIKILFIFLLITSCCEVKEVSKYTNGKVIITRIDRCNHTSFYYGDNIKDSKGRIWAEYSGINDGFRGYLKFYENGKVVLFAGDGYFKSENLNTSKFELKRVLSYENPKIGKDVCYLNLATKFENEDNMAEGSGIKVEYLDKGW